MLLWVKAILSVEGRRGASCRRRAVRGRRGALSKRSDAACGRRKVHGRRGAASGEDLLHAEEIMHELEEVEVPGVEEVVEGILQSMVIHFDRKKRKKVVSL